MDIQEILQKANIQYFDGQGHHHCRPGWIQLDCPYCGKNSGKFHLGYNKHSHYFVCWKCGGLPLIRTLADITGFSYKESKQLCGDIDPVEEEVIVEKRGTLIVPRSCRTLLHQHKEYLRSRKLNPDEIVQLWHVKGIGIASELSWRLFIPIEQRSEVVSWTTRSLKPNAVLRYISAKPEEEKLNHKHLLYGSDFVRHSVVVVEGPIDVWRIGPGAVCTFGLQYTQQQLLKLVKYPIRYICYDNEPKARTRAVALAESLGVFPGQTYQITLDAKDAGEASEKELRKLRKATGIC